MKKFYIAPVLLLCAISSSYAEELPDPASALSCISRMEGAESHFPRFNFHRQDNFCYSPAGETPDRKCSSKLVDENLLAIPADKGTTRGYYIFTQSGAFYYEIPKTQLHNAPGWDTNKSQGKFGPVYVEDLGNNSYLDQSGNLLCQLCQNFGWARVGQSYC